MSSRLPSRKCIPATFSWTKSPRKRSMNAPSLITLQSVVNKSFVITARFSWIVSAEAGASQTWLTIWHCRLRRQHMHIATKMTHFSTRQQEHHTHADQTAATDSAQHLHNSFCSGHAALLLFLEVDLREKIHFDGFLRFLEEFPRLGILISYTPHRVFLCFKDSFVLICFQTATFCGGRNPSMSRFSRPNGREEDGEQY